MSMGIVANKHDKERARRARDPDRAIALRGTLLVLPSLVFITVLFLYPLASLVTTSVYDAGFTLNNYQRLIAQPVYVKVLLNTVRISTIVTLICLALGYPLAYRLFTLRRRAKFLLLIAILMPFVTSLLVRTYGWLVILDPNGLVNTILLRAGILAQPLTLVHNTTGVLIGMTQIMLPYMVLPIAAVMEGTDRALLRAAGSLGASPWNVFVKIFLPLTLPGVYAGCLLVFIICLGFFVVPALMGGTRDILLAQLIQFNVSTVLNWGFAAALSTILLLTTLTVYVLAHRWLHLARLWGEPH
jgi:ABC-type spermidine/putrescine transport system permease subunit I